MFGPLKEMLHGWFSSDDEVKVTEHTWLWLQEENFFADGIRRIVNSYAICIWKRGNYVEKLYTSRVMDFCTWMGGGTCNRPRRTHKVSGGTAQLFLNLGTRRGCVVSITPRPPLPWERPGTHCTGGWVGPGASLDRCG
jgi:hypothetical protein